MTPNKTKINTPDGARKWFNTAIGNITKKIPDGMIDATTNQFPPFGEVVFFKYDPKLKDTLAVYDEHPFLLVTNVDNKGFSGINLHYIHPKIREKMLIKMSEFKDKSKSQKDYIIKTLPILNSFSTHDLFKVAYKNYLPNHVRSKIAIVNHDYWINVSKMNLYKFKKQSAKEVWRN